jgi:hypothetical protein
LKVFGVADQDGILVTRRMTDKLLADLGEHTRRLRLRSVLSAAAGGPVAGVLGRVAAVTLDRGLPAEGAGDMPWLLAGAKTLSYAVNMAALRHAERLGAGDVIFVSSEGYLLEGPRSTVVTGRSR